MQFQWFKVLRSKVKEFTHKLSFLRTFKDHRKIQGI